MFYQADYLIGANPGIPDWLVYDSVSGRAKTLIRLNLFGEVGPSLNHSIWACCLVCNNKKNQGSF